MAVALNCRFCHIPFQPIWGRRVRPPKIPWFRQDGWIFRAAENSRRRAPPESWMRALHEAGKIDPTPLPVTGHFSSPAG